MRSLYLLFAFAILLFSCSADMWIPIQAAPRTPVSFEHVVYLDEMPTKPYDVIGIITPPAGEYETEAEAVKAMRREAAKHGADAIFIESQTESSGWKFSGGPFGASGGSVKNVAFRAKAIVWR
jgi:hypothetical protein